MFFPEFSQGKKKSYINGFKEFPVPLWYNLEIPLTIDSPEHGSYFYRLTKFPDDFLTFLEFFSSIFNVFVLLTENLTHFREESIIETKCY